MSEEAIAKSFDAQWAEVNSAMLEARGNLQVFDFIWQNVQLDRFDRVAALRAAKFLTEQIEDGITRIVDVTDSICEERGIKAEVDADNHIPGVSMSKRQENGKGCEDHG